MDNSKITPLTLLDMSAAFDYINRAILLDCLSVWYGASSVALKINKTLFKD